MNFQKNNWPFLLLPLACFIGYLNSLSGGFMIDDYMVLFGQVGVENKPFLELFNSMQVSFYRPIGHIFLWASHHLFGANAFYYYCANLLLFTIIVLLFYKIIESLNSDRLTAFIGALLFALHPINSMLVNYITANIIATFVITQQLSFLCFVKYLEQDKRGYYFSSILFFLLSLFSHEMSLIFPIFLILVMYFKHSVRISTIFRRCLPFIFLSVGYLCFRMYFFVLDKSIVQIQEVFQQTLLYTSMFGELLGWYLSKLFIPTRIIFLWSLSPDQSIELLNVLIFVLFWGLCLYLIFGRWKKGFKPLALSIFVVGFLPLFIAGFSYYPEIGAMVEPHWFYFSSIGFFMILAYYLAQAVNKYKKYGFTVLMIFVIGYGGLLTYNNFKWKDQEAFCRYWIAENPYNGTPYFWLGRSLLDRGEYTQAIQFLSLARDIPGFSNMLILPDLAYAQYRSGLEDYGKKHLEYLAQFGPTYSVLYYYLSRVYLEEHNYAAAQKMISKALELFPNHKEYQNFRASIPDLTINRNE